MITTKTKDTGIRQLTDGELDAVNGAGKAEAATVLLATAYLGMTAGYVAMAYFLTK